MLISNSSHKIPDGILRDKVIFLTYKALTGPHEPAATKSQLVSDAETHTGPGCFSLVVGLLTGQSAGDNSSELYKITG